MTSRRHDGFTLIEVMIMVVLIAILAATVLAHYGSTTKDAHSAAATYNLATLRALIETYKTHHDGVAPAALDLLTVRTNRWGTTDAADGPLELGPYVRKAPDNPLADVSVANVAKPPSAVPPTATEADAGWLYDAATGGLWLNHADYLSE
ncbi:MAG: type II secretion system GspH family protein [Planctomycetes bacterium]|nr:type II secretion system GspH family protein [Planctomycetota bacterium]